MIVGVIYFYKDINNITAWINPNIVHFVILSPKTLGDGNLEGEEVGGHTGK